MVKYEVTINVMSAGRLMQETTWTMIAHANATIKDVREALIGRIILAEVTISLRELI